MKKTIIPALLALALTSACGTADFDTSTPDKTTKVSKKANSKKTVSSFTAGTYEVPKELKPGKYKTTGPDDDDVISQCVWARLKGFGGEISDIIANGIIEGPAAVTIKSTDKGVEFTGSCKWKRVGK